jgi:hypothetical protein
MRTKIFTARPILQRLLEDEKCIQRCILMVILAQHYFRASVGDALIPCPNSLNHTPHKKKHDVPAVRKLLEMRRRTQTHHLAPRRPNLSLSCLLLIPPLAHHGSTAATSSQELADFFYSDTGS